MTLSKALPVDEFHGRLTQRMKLFAQHYVKSGGKNKIESAMAAGCKTYDCAKEAGKRWSRHPCVKAYMRTLGMRAKELLAKNAVEKHKDVIEATAALARARELAEETQLTTSALDLAAVISQLSEEAQVDMADFMKLEPVMDPVCELVPDYRNPSKMVRREKIDEKGEVVKAPRLGPDGEPVVVATWDIEKAIRSGKAKFIQEIRPTQYGWHLRLVDRQAAKVAIAKILQTIEERQDRQGEVESTMRQWADVVAALKALPPGAPRPQLRQLYLKHIAGTPESVDAVDVAAKVIEESDGTLGHA